MLVIISDLHLTDGSTGKTAGTGAFEIFGQRLQDLAIGASWRTDGTYRPIEKIDLVLLGDVLDIVHSSRWLQSNVRPWHDVHAPEMSDVVARVVDDILRHNSRSLQCLRLLAAENAVRVPVGTHTGQPDPIAQPITVPVRTQYMVGNHDWHLHLRGATYDLLRQKVAHNLGLANSHTKPFPHDPAECEELLETLRRHRVFARHGDIYDPLSFTEDRDSSSLGDAIAIELNGRFLAEVQQEMKGDLPESITAELKQIENIRPLLLVPVWIDGVLQRGCPKPSARKQVKNTWDRLADELLNMPIVRERDTLCPFNLVDGLEGALKFSKRLSTGWATKISDWLHSLRGSSSDSYYQHALSEQDFRNRRARHIVYGHTHKSETVPLDASYADSFVLNQMYFNTGTWRRVYSPTIYSPGQHEFIPSETMSYLAFFQGDERGGRPFETWSGTLGVNPVGVNQPRENAQQPSQTGSQQVSASNINPPHFATISAPRHMLATE